MKNRQNRALRFYWLFLVILLSIFFDPSSGKPNLYFPGQANFKSIPRIGRRSGSDLISGRHPFNDLFRSVPSFEKTSPYQLGASEESTESSWNNLISSNDITAPSNGLLLTYNRKPTIWTTFTGIGNNKENPTDNSQEFVLFSNEH